MSAKTRQGLDDLLETILVMAEVEELRANPDAPASGTVIESKLDPGRGPVVTILIERGTLEVGDSLVAGAHWGRVRAMNDFMGHRVGQALPGEPVEVLGFDGVPEAGEHVRAVENERRARQLATERATRLKAEALARRIRQERLARGHLQVGRAGAQPGDQVRRGRLARGDRGRDRQAAAGRGVGQRDPRRRRRRDRVRRDAGRRVRRDHHGLQRAPGRRRARGGRARGRRDPSLLGDLPRDRGAPRRHAGHARARGGRGDARHGRGAPDLPRLARGHDRRLLT